jgi:hypothetical protein
MVERKKILFEIPEGTPPTTCKGCGARMYFVKVGVPPAVRMMPVDPDGQSHFATCPDAVKFRKEKR